MKTVFAYLMLKIQDGVEQQQQQRRGQAQSTPHILRGAGLRSL